MLANYDELRTEVADFLNRPSLNVDTLIRLADVTLARREELQDEVVAQLNLDAEVVAIPTAAREVTSLFLDLSSGERYPIEVVGPELLPEKKLARGATGRPEFAAVISNGTELKLAPVPDKTYVSEIIYVQKLTPLSAAAPINWLLTEHPDVYLFAALVEAEPYLKDDERIAVWERKLEKAIEDVRKLRVRRTWGANTKVIRPRRPIGG